LRTRLEGMDVILPEDGMTVEKQGKRASRSTQTAAAAGHVLDTLPVGIGNGAAFDAGHIEEVWRAVAEVPTLRIVTARELAIVWYGEATEEYTRRVLDVLDEDYEQRYFVRQHALAEAYRVRGQFEEQAGDFISDLVEHILLLKVSSGSTKPVLCRAIVPGAAIRVQFPRGIGYERTRFPFSAILELIGPAPFAQDSYETGSASSIAVYLADLVRNARRIRRMLSAHELARQCKEEASYTLAEMCMLAGVSPQALDDRLAVAKLIQKNPHLFLQSRPFLEGEGLVLYGLAPSWEEAMAEPEVTERPDQHWILGVVEQYLGSPADLYKRSIDPETGDVTLAFHFPAVASAKYAAAIEAAADETGVSITIAPHTHQGMLTDVARRLLPEGLIAKGKPSIHIDQQLVQISCAGEAAAEAIQQAQERFTEQTGWELALLLEKPVEVQGTYWSASAGSTQRKEQNEAIAIARKTLAGVDGLYKVGVDGGTGTLLLRFYFPDAVQARIKKQLQTIEEKTG
ncbi:MAG TPA: hypothetical protein VIY29_06575, partial [Ktedonobacteraceae bacterium]